MTFLWRIGCSSGAASAGGRVRLQRSTMAVPEVSQPMTADTLVAAQQLTEPQEASNRLRKRSHIPRWGVWLAADVSKTAALGAHRERARRSASLDRRPCDRPFRRSAGEAA